MQPQEMRSSWYCNPYTGLFSELGSVERQPHDPDVSVWSGIVPLPDPSSEPPASGGAAWDERSAEAATVGEAIERMQSWPLPCDRLIESTHRDWPLEEPALGPEHWVLFHESQYQLEQFPFEPWTPTTKIRWVCARNASSGLPYWVPEELVYLSLPRGRCSQLCPLISSALACGRSGHPVLLRGLQEAIERDAAVGASWGRYALVECDSKSIFADLESEYSSRLLRPNLHYRFFRVLTPFSSHTTIVALEGDDRDGYCFSVGAACRETRKASWLKSILEAVQGRYYVRYLKRQFLERGQRLGAPTSFAEHAVYYSLDPDRLQKTVLGQSIKSNRIENADEAADRTEGLADLSNRLGPQRPVLFRNLTPPGLVRERMGWCVLRVLVPGLQPLHGNHALPFLGGPLWSPRTWNDWLDAPPHPFP